MAYPDPVSATIGGILLVILIVIGVWIVLKIFRHALKIVFGVIINSIVGVLAILGLNLFLNIGIPLKAYTLIPVALFGIPSVATLLILRLFGVAL
ncbi:MAG: pro-sigmaK processing inhibitor BofA family protein [Candidatus Micrarchaeota archaeon]|nr:pro-sigmaK processing inhibitor BofA family protein [Candidatus Micrarchaeota archaeon]